MLAAQLGWPSGGVRLVPTVVPLGGVVKPARTKAPQSASPHHHRAGHRHGVQTAIRHMSTWRAMNNGMQMDLSKKDQHDTVPTG